MRLALNVAWFVQGGGWGVLLAFGLVSWGVEPRLVMLGGAVAGGLTAVVAGAVYVWVSTRRARRF